MNTRGIAIAALGAAASGVALLGVAAPASAAVHDSSLVIATCTKASYNPQICTDKPVKKVFANGDMFVKFTASPAHCSNIIARVYIDGLEEGSKFLRPGESMTVDSYVPKGTHSVAVQATGIKGGCNHGSLGGWRGKLRIIT